MTRLEYDNLKYGDELEITDGYHKGSKITFNDLWHLIDDKINCGIQYGAIYLSKDNLKIIKKV